MKKNWWIYALGSVAVIVACFTFYRYDQAKNPKRVGGMRITVRDGTTDLPLGQATLIIPEANLCLHSDEQGRILADGLPILSDSRTQSFAPQDWGEITLLVYAPGYVSHAFFRVQVHPGTIRNGPLLLMFPGEDADTIYPYALAEGPENAWVSTLIEKYRPEDQPSN